MGMLELHGRASVVAILAAFPANRISRVHKMIDPTTAEA